MMNNQQPLNSVDESQDNSSRCEATQRLLCSKVRGCNQACEELERFKESKSQRVKESMGFDKPFPILRVKRWEVVMTRFL
jgi:hypothetical protein